MNDGVLLSLDFVDARAFSLSLSALSALSLSLFSVDLQQTTTLLRCASKKKKRKKSVFFLETTTTTTKAWTTTRSIRDARDVLERMKRNTSSEEGVSVKQRVSKEDVLVSTISKDGEFSVVETFETPSKADEEFRTMVEIDLKKKNDEEGERADERTVASVLAHALAMLARESAFSRGKEEEERERDIFDVVLKRDGRSLATIEGEDWNRTIEEEDGGVDGGVGDVVDDRMMEKDGVVIHADIVAKADFKGCEVTLVFSRTKEAELRIGNDTRGTASSWIREEENAGKKDIRVKKTFSLNPTRIESEESKALDVLFQLPSHFWSKFGFHPIRRLRRRRKEEKDADEEVNDEDVTENDDVSFFRVFDTPEFGTYVYDCDSDDEGDQDDDTGRSADARGEPRQGAEEDDGVDLEEEMELLDLRKQVQELPDFAAMKTNEEEMDAHNVQHLQELYLRDVCVVWRQSKENEQRQQLTSPSLPERFRTCFEKAFMEAKRKNRPNFTSKRERKEWRIGERIMRNAANIYRNAVVNTDLMIDVAKADENIEDWEGKICTLLCQKRAFGQMPLQAQQQKQKQKQ
ncbi:unnamed protein product [Bathycoccus prasinos]